jgi:tetratricopeptide (TPR) repeat protein
VPPEEGGVTPTPNERPQSLKARIAGMQIRYDNGKAALQKQDYRTAISVFGEIVKEEPRYRDAAALIDQARAGLRDSARQTVAAAQRQAAEGQLLEALESFERARRIDAQVDGVDEGVKQVRERMKRAGEDAYKRAKQYDAVGRVPEAIALYEQAVKMLPEGDANRKLAQDRLAALKP